MNTKTEADAAECWCPFARAQAYGCAVNRVSIGRNVLEPHASTYCIASKCMAWRWHREPAGGITEALDRDLTKNPEQGYCGLAQR